MIGRLVQFESCSWVRSKGCETGTRDRQGTLDGLRHKRERRNLDFAASDVGRRTTNADRGHDASALTRLRFDLASAPIKTPCWIEFESHEALGFPQKHKLVAVLTESRQFHKFIIITMILTSTHDSAIRWEEVLRLLDYF